MKPILLNNQIKMTGPEKTHQEILNMQIAAGEIISYRFEPWNFSLANNLSYKPDFLVIFHDHFEIHEIKAGILNKNEKMFSGKNEYKPLMRGDECLTKLKIVAKEYPWFKVKLFWYWGKRYERMEWREIK